MTEIPAAEYASGRIFVGAPAADAPANNYVSAITSTLMPAKKFKSVKEPVGGASSSGVKVCHALVSREQRFGATVVLLCQVQPRHDPTAPDAVILQRPADGEQGFWVYPFRSVSENHGLPPCRCTCCTGSLAVIQTASASEGGCAVHVGLR